MPGEVGHLLDSRKGEDTQGNAPLVLKLEVPELVWHHNLQNVTVTEWVVIGGGPVVVDIELAYARLAINPAVQVEWAKLVYVRLDKTRFGEMRWDKIR